MLSSLPCPQLCYLPIDGITGWRPHKGGKHLEVLAKIDTVILDKTGTITQGIPQVHRVYFEDADDDSIYDVLYSLEKQSNHPLAKAIVEYFCDRKDLAITSREIPGKGIEGEFLDSLYQVGNFECDISRDMKDLIDDAHEEGYTTVRVVKNGNLIGLIDRSGEARCPSND